MRIITRQEAIARGLKKYFTGKPCKHGHVAERYVQNCWCVACNDGKTKNDSNTDPVTTNQVNDVIIPSHARTLYKITRLVERFNIDRDVLLYAALEVGLTELLNSKVTSTNKALIKSLGRSAMQTEHN